MSETPAAMEKLNLLGASQAQLNALFAGLGEKPYRTTQVMKWIHHRYVDRIEDMSDISRSLRAVLATMAEIREPEILLEKVASDGTRKWLVKAASGSAVEMVFIPEEGRGTLCVSSQVGCALDCKFCSTGKQGFNSNLTSAEIIGQLRIAIRTLASVYPDRSRVVTNVVMMGMGEPLLNFDPVTTAVDVMMDDLGYGISKRKVTISTAGIVPAIYKLARTTDASLAVSLHAPNDALRDQLVPVNRKYNIAELLKACRTYAENFGQKRTVTIEYTLLDGVNDAPAHAAELADLLQDFPCKINLIPFNPYPDAGFRRPSMIAVRAFQDRLVKAGHSVTVRTTRGGEIQAACGQLVGQVADKTRRQAHYRKIAAEVLA
jgi:23S rRNA (adenine2503-C2)-methyltransferase